MYILSYILGVSDAQFSLGQYHYHHGNYVDALRLFEMAEAGGNTQAKYQLGVMYYDGVGVGEDMVRRGGEEGKGGEGKYMYYNVIPVSSPNSGLSLMLISPNILHALFHSTFLPPCHTTFLPSFCADVFKMVCLGEVYRNAMRIMSVIACYAVLLHV